MKSLPSEQLGESQMAGVSSWWKASHLHRHGPASESQQNLTVEPKAITGPLLHMKLAVPSGEQFSQNPRGKSEFKGSGTGSVSLGSDNLCP